MVKLTEVEDEHFTATQAGPRGAGGPKNSKTVIEEEDDDDYFTDTGACVVLHLLWKFEKGRKKGVWANQLIQRANV